VDFVLDLKTDRGYRKYMSKRGPLTGIGPEHLQEALARSRFAREGGKGHSALARHIAGYQQGVRRVLEGVSIESGMKWPIVQALAPELFEIAKEKKYVELMKILYDLGLKQKNDDAMTITREGRGGDPNYTFDLYEPMLIRGDVIMLFPKVPSAKIRPPNFMHSEKSYAFRMAGDSMDPIFESGMILDVDPALEPRIGDACTFFSQDHARQQVGKLVNISPDTWQISTRPKTLFEKNHALSRNEWPICEVIVSCRRR
jgi:hypothetical protein